MYQLGFDLEYTDPITQELVPWADPTPSLLNEIASASWKFFDTETTGLNPASKEVTLNGKQLQRGARSDLRLRVSSVSYMHKHELKSVSFDMDRHGQSDRKNIIKACFSQAVFAHNAGFDAYWARSVNRDARPKRVIDSMLLARVLAPDHPLKMAKLIGDESAPQELRQHAFEMFQQGRAGWSLADLAAGRLGIILPKDSQGPRNWCEPFLTQKNYDYAVGDTRTGYLICMELLGAQDGEDLLEKYLQAYEASAVLQLVEPQVMDIMTMRENGVPWDQEHARRYVQGKYEQVKELAAAIGEQELSLKRFESVLADPFIGVPADLKVAVGEAFSRRGVSVQLTDKSGAFKVGEKDLRQARAASSSEAKSLFKLWSGLNRAKKAAGMAREVSRYAMVANDARLHPNTGHGPVTGRLSSSEPNCQQFPRDQEFRNCVAARPNHLIAAHDYSALDMRVGAALAIRAQEQIAEVHLGLRSAPLKVQRVIERVYSGAVNREAAEREHARATAALERHRRPYVEIEGLSKDGRKRYWEIYRTLQETAKLAHFQRCLAVVRANAKAAGTETWGSLRNAFSIPGMDIHTWTALGMLGQDPQALFSSLKGAEVAEALKSKKKELGDHRQTGKVGNLSLLYAMMALGLQEAAAKNYDIHWTLEESAKVRADWLATYVEIDLWHIWTEFNSVEQVQVPDPDRGGRMSRKSVFASQTLGGRTIYAFGLNAALSYEDQSTGADILGKVMATLRKDHPLIFQTVINQVHDEVVFEIPEANADAYTDAIDKVMTDCANYFLMPYGIPGESSRAVGKNWLKD